MQQLVHAAYVCRSCRRVDQDKWDDISAWLNDFLDSVQEKFESYHPDWDDGDLYIDWNGLNEPFYGSNMDGGSDSDDSTQEMHHEVEFDYDRNSVHEYRRRVVDEYELFVSWLGNTNQRKVHKEFHDHLLRLREEDKYAHTPVHFPGVLGTKRS